MLFADRLKLRLALNNESLKPVRSHKQIIFALPFGSEDSMTAINFVNAQLDADESVYPYACEQDKVAIPRILFEAKERYQKEGKLDLGQLFD